MKNSTRALEQNLRNLLGPIRLKWQLIFLSSTLAYAASAYHALRVRPEILWPPSLLHNLDTVSLVIVVFLALLIFHIKRRYFSTLFIRHQAAELLASRSAAQETELLRQVFTVLQAQLLRVWILAALIIAVGIVFYWATHWSRNLHIYFAVGGLSLLLNYPQKSLFADLPWLIKQEWQDAQQNEQDTD